MTAAVKRTPQYAQTGPCWARSQCRVSTYAVRLVGCDVSDVGVAEDPDRRRRREGRGRDLECEGASWLARDLAGLDDELWFRLDRSCECLGPAACALLGGGVSRYGESYGV